MTSIADQIEPPMDAAYEGRGAGAKTAPGATVPGASAPNVQKGGEARNSLDLHPQGDSQRETVAALRRALADRRLSAALTGYPGTGKTAVLDMALDRPPSPETQVLRIDDPSTVDDAQAEGIAGIALGLADAGQENSKTVVIVVDDAHAASPALLRCLARIAGHGDARRPAQILLVGRPELWDRLGANELAPLNDRLILRLDLKPFDERTSKAYIDSLLVKPRRIVGQAFTSDAEREIINRAQGKADRIKALVNATLLQADAQAYPPITINQVLAATNGAQKAESQEADHKETAQTFSSDFLPGAHKTATSRGRPANKAARSLERLPVSWRSKRVLAATGAAVVVASAGILWLQPKKPQTVPPAPPAHSTAFPAAGLPEAGAARDRASVDRPHQEAARGTASLTASLRAGRAPDASPPVVPPAASTPMPATAATDRPPSPMPGAASKPEPDVALAPATAPPVMDPTRPSVPPASTAFTSGISPGTENSTASTPIATPAPVPLPLPHGVEDRAKPVPAPLPAPQPLPAPAAQTTEPSPPRPTPALPPRTLEALLRRGNEMLDGGDPVSARRFFERAATAGNAAAMLGMARTFDPMVVGQDALANLATATTWYALASTAGNPEAATRLRQLEKAR